MYNDVHEANPEIIKDWAQTGLGHQCLYHNFAIGTEWMLWVDLDEFLMPPRPPEFSNDLYQYLNATSRQFDPPKTYFSIGMYIMDLDICSPAVNNSTDFLSEVSSKIIIPRSCAKKI